MVSSEIISFFMLFSQSFYSPNPGIIINSVYQVNPTMKIVQYAAKKYMYMRSDNFKYPIVKKKAVWTKNRRAALFISPI